MKKKEKSIPNVNDKGVVPSLPGYERDFSVEMQKLTLLTLAEIQNEQTKPAVKAKAPKPIATSKNTERRLKKVTNLSIKQKVVKRTKRA